MSELSKTPKTPKIPKIPKISKTPKIPRMLRINLFYLNSQIYIYLILIIIYSLINCTKENIKNKKINTNKLFNNTINSINTINDNNDINLIINSKNYTININKTMINNIQIFSKYQSNLTPLNKILRNLQKNPVCPIGFYLSIQQGIIKCLQCSLGCIACLSNRMCIKCDSTKNFTLYASAKMELYCRQCTDNCEKCTLDNLKCEKCNMGYYPQDIISNDIILNKKNTCEKCGEICSECITENECIKCNEDKYYYNDNENIPENININSTSINSINPINPNNTINNLVGFKRTMNCIRCDKKTCEKCIPENNTIIVNNTQILGCEKTKSGFYLETIDFGINKKIKITKNCHEGCTHCFNENTCNICNYEKSYRLENNKCIKCSQNCQECQSMDICQKCADGFFLSKEANNKTKISCKACKKDCKKCENYEKCSECISPFQLNPDKTNCNFCNLNCEICESGNCEMCKKGFYKIGDNACKICEVQNCEKCDNKGFCEICEKNFVLDKFNGSCKTCQLNNCMMCSSNTGKCEKCIDGYFLLNDKCVSCPISNCDNCSFLNDIFKCNTCSNGFFLNEDLKKCENCKEFFGQNCDKCEDGSCLSCINSSNLIHDKESKFYGKCLKCEDGFFLKDLKTCEKCDDFYDLCEDCSSERCTKCNNKSILINDVCECISSFYLRIGPSCVEIYIIILPILTLLLLILGLLKMVYRYYLRKLSRNQNRADNNNNNNENNNENNDNNNDNNENIHINQKEKREKLYKKARKNDDKIHGINCVFCDQATVYWKFNCNGFICNPCSLKLVTSYDSDKANCPKCKKDFKEFKFILNSGKNDKEKVLIDDIKQDVKNNLEQTISDNICKICFVLKQSVRIKCQSNLEHFLCYYCHNRMILIEDLKQCPFDRTEINK
jgi:hypothetical protein